MHAQERLLDHVLRLAHRAEHPVGDRERARAEFLEYPGGRVVHAVTSIGRESPSSSPSRKPSRQLG